MECTNNTVKQRILWLDMTKLLAIFLVLWGHCAQHFLTTDEWANYIYIYLYSFHMPLFMVISGFFAGNIFKYSFSTIIHNKTWQLLMPVLLWGTLLYIIDVYIIGKDIPSFHDALFNRYFWFLKSLFFCFLLFAAGTYLFKHKYIGLIIALIVSQLFAIYKIRYMFPCFVFGYILNMNLNYFTKYIWRILVISAIIFIAMLPGWGVDKMWPSVSLNQLINDPLSSSFLLYYKLITGLAGSIVCICICYLIFKKMNNSRFIQLIGKWGQYTLSIYVIQSLVLETILAYFINIDSTNDWRLNFILFPVISLIVLILCVYLHKVMLKNAISKFFLLPSWNQFHVIITRQREV